MWSFMYHLVPTCLTHSFPMHPFSTHWKHQKTMRFSYVFMGWRKGALGRNGLIWDSYSVLSFIMQNNNTSSNKKLLKILRNFFAALTILEGELKSSVCSGIRLLHRHLGERCYTQSACKLWWPELWSKTITWDKVFKNISIKICGREPLKMWNGVVCQK